jgi:hypothetical protein
MGPKFKFATYILVKFTLVVVPAVAALADLCNSVASLRVVALCCHYCRYCRRCYYTSTAALGTICMCTSMQTLRSKSSKRLAAHADLHKQLCI